MPKKYQFDLAFDVSLEKYVNDTYPEILDYRIISKSLDARGAPRGKRPYFHYTLEALVDKNDQYEPLPAIDKTKWKDEPVIIIGAGPCGLFCALRLSEHGIPSIIIERGDEASRRMLQIAKFWRYGELNPESNVCFGEGGAGLFSDGKLITRIKSPLVKYVMQKFVDFGAPPETAYTANPHLGSNKIRAIISTLSHYLKNNGHKILYNTRVDEILFENKQVVGVKLHDGQVLKSKHLVLAVGHSAKEMYTHLAQQKVGMKAKDFAVGVRIEHKREAIDRMQHGQFCESPILGAARYRLSYHDQATDRGTYSFCMCPGGYVLSSGTEKDAIVVNGMSNFARNSPWSNSALVVTIKSGLDFDASKNVLAGLDFIQDIERKAQALSLKHADGRNLPAMRVDELMEGKLSARELPKTSSPSGIFKADMAQIFPDFIIKHLKNALKEFEKQMPGFMQSEAILIAPETRTSSPVTVLRDKMSLESTTHKGLYPGGEGAGHAGGITSAAVDGVKIADSIMQSQD